jgi:hypothetical protein
LVDASLTVTPDTPAPQKEPDGESAISTTSGSEVAVPPLRPDETYHRLLFWTYGQLSERLAGHLLAAEGYTSLDPSHPLGGPDQGADAMCLKDGEKWVMASFFEYGPHTFTEIKKKLTADIDAARHREPHGVAFVTNQKLTNGEKTKLRAAGGGIEVDLFHLERNVHILDRPEMAQIREQYIYIPATGLPPMSIKASVEGTAHAFTDDAELLDRFVWMREKRIRERSEEGHALVRAEREAKDRAEQEKRAREAAEKAREEAMKNFPRRAWDMPVAGFPRMTDILGPSRIIDAMATERASSPFLARSILGGEPPKPPEPLSEEQIQEKVARYRFELQARWPACRDYLAAVAWPALRVRIGNDAESFLTDVQVILTFHGARGIDFEGLAAFEFEKVRDPSWEPPSDPRFGRITVPMPRLAPPSDYPIEWRHTDDADLEVTVTLPRLRPHPEWRSEAHGDDIVLVLDPGVDIDEIAVTFTATAHGYGKAFVGDPFTVPVERVAMLDVLKGALDATREAS